VKFEIVSNHVQQQLSRISRLVNSWLSFQSPVVVNFLFPDVAIINICKIHWLDYINVNVSRTLHREM
jgi:hypothetical protein